MKKLLLLMALAITLSPRLVFAISADDLQSMRQGYDTVFYDPTDIANTTCAGTTNLAGNDNAAKIWNYLIGKGLTPTGAAGIMGNLQAESGFNPKIVQGGGESDTILIDGVTGYGIAQWTDIGRQKHLAEFAQQQSKAVSDLGLQLDFLMLELGGTVNELNQQASVGAATVFFHQAFERSADGPDQIANRIGFAESALAQFGSITGGEAVSGGVGGSGCASAGIVANNIVKTALNLAWPFFASNTTTREQAKPEYQAAHDQYAGASYPYAACDVFVATVMHATGIDPNFPVTNAPAQLKYMQDHPEKYQVVQTSNSAEGLLPGDILNNGGHTVIFTGPQPNGYNAVDSSLGERVPGAQNWGGWTEPVYTAFRVIS